MQFVLVFLCDSIKYTTHFYILAMPELPEVETVVKTLAPKLLGHRLKALEAVNTKTVELLSPFRAFRIENIWRRGKYILLLGENCLVSIHLRMTGRLLETPTHLKHVRAKLIFDNFTLSFEDLRKFGRIVFAQNIKISSLPGIKHLGPEPWDDNLTEFFTQKAKRAKTSLKTFLLNQKNLAGIGNIYADEICFHAKTNPLRLANSLTKKEIAVLLNSTKYILTKAIALRGTTFAHFIDANGKKGNNFEYLKVYGRKGKNCFQCNQILHTKKVQGRTTVYCTNCQS